MSFKLLGTSFGQDRDVALAPATHVWVGYLNILLGLLSGWSALTDRAQQQNIVGLCVVGAIFFLGLGTFVVARIQKDTTPPMVASIGWSHLTVTQGNAHRGEVALREIKRTLLYTDRYRTNYLYESDAGRKQLIPHSVVFKPEDATSVLALIEIRARLHRAGVDTREELAAAEAYVLAASLGKVPFAVATKATKKGETKVWLVETESDAPEALAKKCVLYVPSRRAAVVSESLGTTVEPLHGVD